jgi:capsular exopolysaccharide synthesis family protein
MPFGKELSDLGLRDYLQILRRRRVLIALLVAVIVGSALVASFLQTPVYTAKAELLLQGREGESLFDPNTGQRSDPVRAIETEIRVLKSEPVRLAVRKKLGVAPKVDASPVGQTDVIQVSAVSTSPSRAAAIANAYASEYIDFRRTQAVADLVQAGKQIQNQVTDLERELAQIDQELQRAPAAQRQALEASQSSRRESLTQQHTLFKQKLDELQVDAALRSGGAQLVTSAQAPTAPSAPKPIRSGILALFVALCVGVGTALLAEYLDDSIKTKADVDQVVPDAPVLGLVPSVQAWREKDKPQVISISAPSSAAAEAYRALRTSIQFMALDRPMRTLQVTSANAGEGKTTTLANLAIALARAGQRVIVVCCDLRRPRVHEFFWLTNGVGFTSVLLGDSSLSSAIQAVPGEERVKLLASGPAPPNPSELLGGRRAVELFTALQNESDIVLIDSPPVLPVTDAAVLSSRVDATLLVATAGETTQKELHRAYELLKQVDAPLIGTVLNGVSADAGYGYEYQYKSYVKPGSDPRPTARPRRSGDKSARRL